MNIMRHLGFTKKQRPGDKELITPTDYRLEFSDTVKRKEGETRIYNLVILDESGSMHRIASQAFNGANETIETIKFAQKENSDDNQMFALVTFDSGNNRPDVRIIVDCKKIEDVSHLQYEQYQPYGSTPLYDAMGLSITALRKLVKEGDHVLVTVITDGFENSSTIYTADMIKSLVDELSKQGWVFTYIGANQDSEQYARGLGISNTMDFEASIAGSGLMFDKMQSSRRRFYKKVRHGKETGCYYDLDIDFFSEKESQSRITPEVITELKEGQIFVFGSNLEGKHDGGAAKLAAEKFGAINGQGDGLQGRSYAIPTMHLDIREIKGAVDTFIMFADMHPEMTFLVTRIGCGAAGYSDELIAPLFARAYSLPNVYLPASFWKVLSYRYN